MRAAFVVALLLVALLYAPWAFCAASAVILTVIVLKTPPAISPRSERARLLADCHTQHAAWKRLDDDLAFYGRYQPTPIEEPVVNEPSDA